MTENTNDCLGIFPIITTAANAIWTQQLFSSVSCDIISNEKYNAVSALDDAEAINETLSTDVHVSLTDKVSENTMIEMATSNMFGDYAADTMSTIAAGLFPLINYKNAEHLDTTYLKQIGICVFRAYTDSSNSGKINY